MKKDTPFLIVGGDHLFSFAFAKFFGYFPFSDFDNVGQNSTRLKVSSPEELFQNSVENLGIFCIFDGYAIIDKQPLKR